MRKTLFLTLVFISVILIALRFFSKPLNSYFNFQPRSGIRVESNTKAKVFINKQEVGETPFQKEDLKTGEHMVELKADKYTWQGYVRTNPGTLTIVNRELSENTTQSTGEVISLEKGNGKGNGLLILSNPSEADVEIDGKIVGKTPLSVDDPSPGEHQFMVSKNGFLKRSIRSVLTDGFKLVMSVDLSLSELDLTKLQTSPIESTQYVLIKPTPTGFLRVRSEPSISGNEIGRVLPGEKLVLLEDLNTWKKIKLTDGREGYVSSQYVEKLN
ncbi:MAG: PEGA domain protein [Candidatus Daviesbacteria bacterium GW2011_GWA2_38_24]|uniref:PEGA domain protein n=1 Tax=Candidatus Daviesbacteria bacterium GW2011_GWA2_38_24 TaxID=1618422 RepID=A0A0G0MPY2_9BACT|nr:MAG: PEGA domain protein [Candidatus Daviesbacteria bacterium GW2011_GWA2_38_24]OGE22751.1 MAG: hypothetical protein A2688_01410 [Candidatus Daviesbacteria bacterium RIFCSPHIGHO2_01_FULL_38_8]